MTNYDSNAKDLFFKVKGGGVWSPIEGLVAEIHAPDYEEDEQEINEDELIGSIMRRTTDLRLEYEEVKAVLDAEMDFLKEKGIAK